MLLVDHDTSDAGKVPGTGQLWKASLDPQLKREPEQPLVAPGTVTPAPSWASEGMTRVGVGADAPNRSICLGAHPAGATPLSLTAASSKGFRVPAAGSG